MPDPSDKLIAKKDLAKPRGISGAATEAEFFKSARPSLLIQRFATIDEVASLIAYNASVAASRTTGSALGVGGVVRSVV